MNLKSKIAAIAAATAIVLSSLPAEAKIYRIVIGGVATPFDCPESPLGHTLTWVNQTCKQVRHAGNTGGTPPAESAGFASDD